MPPSPASMAAGFNSSAKGKPGNRVKKVVPARPPKNRDTPAISRLTGDSRQLLKPR